MLCGSPKNRCAATRTAQSIVRGAEWLAGRRPYLLEGADRLLYRWQRWRGQAQINEIDLTLLGWPWANSRDDRISSLWTLREIAYESQERTRSKIVGGNATRIWNL